MTIDIEQNFELVNILIQLFKEKYTGNENAIKKENLTAHIVVNSGFNTSERRVRHAISYIRLNDLMKPGFIVSDVKIGYWLSNDETEMDTFLNKQLNRMTNQFQNLKQLHQRIRYDKPTGRAVQQQLF